MITTDNSEFLAIDLTLRVEFRRIALVDSNINFVHFLFVLNLVVIVYFTQQVIGRTNYASTPKHMGSDNEAQTDRRQTRVYSREQFDDYLVDLIARICFNDDADHIVSGENQHPLSNYQRQHSAALDQLKVMSFNAAQLIEDRID